MRKRKKSKISQQEKCMMREKCRLLVGEGDYIPPSYLHLGHYWKCLGDKEFMKGEEYALLRGLALKSQNRKILWIHQMDKFQCSSWEMSLKQMRHVEQLWRQMIHTLTCRDIGLLDWLVHDAILYDLPRETVRRRINDAVCVLQRL